LYRYVLGDGSHFRDFIHVSDIARGLVMSYQNPEARGVTVNLGSGDAVSVKEVADMVSAKQVGSDTTFHHVILQSKHRWRVCGTTKTYSIAVQTPFDDRSIICSLQPT
jgi:nucleoside-diphosphate-sugar epimerase